MAHKRTQSGGKRHAYIGWIHDVATNIHTHMEP